MWKLPRHKTSFYYMHLAGFGDKSPGTSEAVLLPFGIREMSTKVGLTTKETNG